MRKIAVITGACGGIGIEITRAVADAGYQVVMACRNIGKATVLKDRLVHENNRISLDVVELDLSSLQSVRDCAGYIKKNYKTIDLLMNNAGTISTRFEQTVDGIEKTVSTNYVGHYLFTRLLIPQMHAGSRIVNMISCTYPMGCLDFPEFFTHGRKGSFLRLPIYSNTKLALLLFTCELSRQLKEKGISVNAADPGIVSTDMIRMNQWFDPLANLFFRPFIRTPQKGAASSINLLLKQEYSSYSGSICSAHNIRYIPGKYVNHTNLRQLWKETEDWVKPFM